MGHSVFTVYLVIRSPLHRLSLISGVCRQCGAERVSEDAVPGGGAAAAGGGGGEARAGAVQPHALRGQHRLLGG